MRSLPISRKRSVESGPPVANLRWPRRIAVFAEFFNLRSIANFGNSSTVMLSAQQSGSLTDSRLASGILSMLNAARICCSSTRPGHRVAGKSKGVAMIPRSYRTKPVRLVPLCLAVGLLISQAAAAQTTTPSAQTTTPSAQTTTPSAQTTAPVPTMGGIQALRLFEQHCFSCHGSPGPDSRAPNREALQQLTPERVLAALTTGAMAEVANQAGLTDGQKRGLALAVSGRPLGSGVGAASAMKNKCSTPSPLGDLAAGPGWNGWSPDDENARFQSAAAAGLTVEQLSKLKLKWAFGFPGATAMYSQPTIVSKHVFVSSDAGFVYSLDAVSGCVYWSFEAGAGVRGAVTIGSAKGIPGVRYVAYFGDLHTNVYGVDADTGKLLWKTKVETHPIARITGPLKISGDRLFVPVSSLEEVAAGANVSYECCTFRGSVVALELGTGRQLWKTYSIVERPVQMRKNSIGTVLWINAGAAIWGSPTIDLKRKAIYVGTGDAYTAPAPDTANAVLALDYDTGKILWSRQIVANDAWIIGCTPRLFGGPPPELRPQNCPDESQQSVVQYDVDATTPILKTLSNGRTLLFVYGEFGEVTAVDPDRKGEVVWQTHLGEALPSTGENQPGLRWGAAADDQNLYLPLERREGGMTALKLSTGQRVWHAWGQKANCPEGVTGCNAAQDSAATLIPGAVFSGAADGMLRAYSTTDGHIVWEFNTARTFPTVNDVTAKGGSLKAAGPTIAGGMLFVGSGYAGSMPGNVLLAFDLAR
jgi:polyvinyl alcohol dehydrogenase (cytochrome)